MDQKIEKELWLGQVPVFFNLEPNEVTTMDKPLPLFLLLPRMGYLPLLVNHIREHFMSYAPTRQDEMWFECGGIPLRWTTPIGVIYDLLAGDTDLPLPIIVHFLSFPERKLIRYQNLMNVKSYYLNTLKEAWYLKYGDCSSIMDLNMEDYANLWQSVVLSSHELYRPICQSLRNNSSNSSNNHGSDSNHDNSTKLHHYPVRFLFSGFEDKDDNETKTLNKNSNSNDIKHSSPSSTTTQTVDHVNPLSPSLPTQLTPIPCDFFFVQMPISTQNNPTLTLGGLIEIQFPALLASSSSSPKQTTTDTDIDTDTSSPFSCSSDNNHNTHDHKESSPVHVLLDDVHILIHGTCPPLDTPVEWLCQNMCHADQFVYLSVIRGKPVRRHMDELTLKNVTAPSTHVQRLAFTAAQTQSLRQSSIDVSRSLSRMGSINTSGFV